MVWRKRIPAFIILFLLVSTFAVAMHHHEDTADDHHDCPTCLVSHHQQATSQSTVAFDGVPFITESIYTAFAPVLAEKIFISCLNNRAPPA
jgi:hypothetical protein